MGCIEAHYIRSCTDRTTIGTDLCIKHRILFADICLQCLVRTMSLNEPLNHKCTNAFSESHSFLNQISTPKSKF